MFNRATLSQLAQDYARIDGFDPDRFLVAALAGLPARELLDRLAHIADCIEVQLSPDFPTMADQLETAMPPPLDPSLRDDDFGQFIHAVPGILAVRHGLEDHRDRAMDLLYAATQRFSMEFYIRPFLNRWPVETMEQLATWARDPNYHVRRLVSEGTRPRLPWAKNIDIDPMAPLPLLDALHADPTRYVTRSVANHLNDISKFAPDVVIDRLTTWQGLARQSERELHWMRRHALRTLLKSGDPRAMAHLGYATPPAARCVGFQFTPSAVPLGAKARVEATLEVTAPGPLLVDYKITFEKTGKPMVRSFRIKDIDAKVGVLTVGKSHLFKAQATTFNLPAGTHSARLFVNGTALAETQITLT